MADVSKYSGISSLQSSHIKELEHPAGRSFSSDWLPPVSEGRGGTVFTGVCSHLWGGDPYFHPIILPLVPYPFLGVPQLHPIILPLVPGPFLGRGDIPILPDGGPHAGEFLVRMGEVVPPFQVRYQVRTEGGGVPPNWKSKVCTCYVEGGMPLAFTQEDFLVRK